MESFQLYRQSGERVNVWVCGKCGRVGWNKDAADRCCVPHTCKTCGKEEKMAECYECSKAREAVKELARYDAAEKITNWNGWVYSDGLGYKNGYFESLEDLLDYLESQPEFSQPEYVWACKATPFVSVDADSLYEQIENDERAYEDFERGCLQGTEQLEAALEAFSKANETIVSYFPDYTKAVLIVGQ